MKIIQLVYSLCSGGAERFVVSLSNCLAEMGHDVEICMLLDDNEETRVFNKQFLNSNVRFCSMKFKSGFALHKMWKTEAYIQSQHPDVVHCHLNVIPYIYGLSLKNKNIRFVHTLHNVAQHASGSRYQYLLNKFFYRKRIIQPVTISKKCQESYEDFYHLKNASFIDNGCAFVAVSDSIENVKREVARMKKCDKTPVFIHVARFDSQKNQGLLIDSFNELYAQGIDFLLVILGNGYQSKSAVELRKKACQNIHFLGEKNNVGDYLSCSDAFCLTSNYEGLPISLLEALSVGVTPICTAVGGIPDVIKDGETGYLAESVAKDSYIAAVKRFLKQPIDQDVLKEHFRKHFSMQNCAEKYLYVYQKK